MQHKIALSSLAIALAATCYLPSAQALEAGDFIARAGLANVAPSGPSGNPTAVEAEENTQLGLTASYMLNPNLAVGVLASSPFNHDILVTGNKIGSTKQLPPTVTLQYHFSDLGKIKPYIGAGVNYTAFFDEKLTGGAKIELDDSVGLALEAGVDIELSNDLYFNAAIWSIDIETTAKQGSTVITDNVNIDPIALMLGIGKKF